MRVALLVPLALLGCEKKDPLFCKMNPTDPACTGIDAALVDGREIDTPLEIDASARLCFGAGAYEVCLASPAIDTVAFTAGATINTGTSNTMCLATQPSNWMTAGQPESCFIIGVTVAVPNITVIGPRPLVLLAATTINVSGSLDVASHRGGAIGAGAPFSGCAAFPDAPDNFVDGGGGGAGASFLSFGGNGGNGGGVGSSNGTAPSIDSANPTRLRAGCHGQAGGTGNGGAPGGVPGGGGGAVYLIAGNEITLGATAVINANGAGSERPGREAGGGGGGSGGMIMFYASMITATSGAIVMANGGGGSSGANDNGNGNALDGNDPVNPLTPATGGTPPPAGAGAGGNGFAEPVDATGGGPGVNNRGGGGGGGGKGYIQTNVALTNATVSPGADVIP